jgi:hypothetical protein
MLVEVGGVPGTPSVVVVRRAQLGIYRFENSGAGTGVTPGYPFCLATSNALPATRPEPVTAILMGAAAFPPEVFLLHVVEVHAQVGGFELVVVLASVVSRPL